LNNVEAQILDHDFGRTPPGVPGELHLAGAGLARGYLDAGLTAATFVPHPCAGKPGERLYATGDIACWLPSGEISVIGRSDSQVKIRGGRVDLGSIEAVLRGHPGVEDAIVVARNFTGETRLVAYIVGPNGAAIGIHDLVSFLKRNLPDYQVPTYFARIEALPRGENGKIDFSALPENGLETVARAITPANEVEAVIAEEWAKLLGLEAVGASDNFFELGGHSLLVTRFVAQIQDVIPTEPPLLAMFFEDPTAAGLARGILSARTGGSEREIAETIRVALRTPFPEWDAAPATVEASGTL
jgi:hypothetical protein